MAAAHGASIAEEATPPDVAPVAHVLPLVPVLVARANRQLTLNARPDEARYAIDVPDTRPRRLDVRFERDGRTVVRSEVFAAGERRALEVGAGLVTLTTVAGAEYDLRAIEGASFVVELLSAGRGTSLLLTYGHESKPWRILVDCGTQEAGRRLCDDLRDRPSGRELELLVLTHIDDDRIGGAVPLLEDRESPEPRDVWFNGRAQLGSGEDA